MIKVVMLKKEKEQYEIYFYVLSTHLQLATEICSELL